MQPNPLGQSVTNCTNFVPGKWKLEQCQTCKYPRSAHVQLSASSQSSVPSIITTAPASPQHHDGSAPLPPPRTISHPPPSAVRAVKPLAKPAFAKPSAPAPARPKVRPLPTPPRPLPKTPPAPAATTPPSALSPHPNTTPLTPTTPKKAPPRPPRTSLTPDGNNSRERNSSSAGSSPAQSPRHEEIPAASSAIPAPALSPEEEKQKRRTYIAKEIVQTEENYVKNLKDLIECFKRPLESRKVITPEDSKIIFMNAEALLGLQEALLTQLQKRMENWNATQQIADVILTIVPFLKLYTEYVNGFDASNARLDTMLKNSDMYRELNGCDIVKELDKCGKDSFHGSVGLSSLSLTPILRIPRYVLLLKDLKKYTDESHPDYQNICNAFEKMSEMAAYINEFKRKSEGNQRMLEVNEKLRGDLEPLREYAVDPETDPKPHAFEKSRFVLPTWCDFCGKFIMGIAPTGQKCTVCSYVCHDECLEHTAPDCGNVRSEPSILQSFRMFVREAAARHKQYQPGVYTQGIDSRERNALVMLFNDSMLICYPDDGHYEFGAFVPFVNRKRSRVLEVRMGNSTTESSTLSIICPRTTATHILDFGKAKVRDSWAQGIKEGVEKWQKTMADASSKQSLVDSAKHLRSTQRRKGDTLPHASQIFTPSEIEHIMKNQGREIKFTFTSTVPVWDAKEKKEFIAYVIEAMLPNAQGTLTSVTFMKRYSQFDELHEHLEKRFKKQKIQLPKLPTKKWFGNTDVDFVQKRMRQLEEYMNQLARIPEVFNSDIMEKWFKQSLDSPDTIIDEDASDSAHVSAAEKRARRRSYIGPSGDEPEAAASSSESAPVSPAAVSAVAQWDFVAEAETELSLYAGDVITLLDYEADAPWWYGSHNGREGYFPANYVQIST